MEDQIIDKKWAEPLIKRVEKYINRGDCINLWGLPAIGRSGQIEYIRQNLPKHLILLPIETNGLTSVNPASFYNLLNSNLEPLLENPIKIDKSYSPSIATHRLLDQITTKYKVFLVIDSLEYITTLDNRFFRAFKALRDRYLGKLSFAFVSERPLNEHPRYSQDREFLDFSCHIKTAVKPLDDVQSYEGLCLMLTQYDLKLSTKEKQEVLELAGGIIGIFKSILRCLESQEKPCLNSQELLKDSHITTRLERIYSSFTTEEKKALQELSSGGENTQTTKTEYFTTSGILREGKIRSKLFEAFVRNLPRPKTLTRKTQVSTRANPILKIDFDTGEIYKSGLRLKSFLSREETQILQLMVGKGEAITSREDVAKALWGKNYIEKYSDWAIDKCISRIRIKIEDTKRPFNHLATIKARGFKLYLSPKLPE